MKFLPIGIMAAAALAGCQAAMTLEEAQAECTKRGGLLTIIYTQHITASGIGQATPSAGDCISPERFEAGTPLPPGTTPSPK